jgi:hypothetical protein
VPDGGRLSRRAAAVYEHERLTIRSKVLGAGTLACGDCDAPIAIGDRSLSLGDELTCPFCGRLGPARDFLSLAAPTRPARVLVRMLIP